MDSGESMHLYFQFRVVKVLYLFIHMLWEPSWGYVLGHKNIMDKILMGVLKQVINPFSSILHPCCGPDTEVLSEASPVTAYHNLATYLKKVTRKAQDVKGDYYKKDGGQES